MTHLLSVATNLSNNLVDSAENLSHSWLQLGVLVQTFHSFLVVLVLALIAQIPDDSRTTFIISLGFVGVQGIGRLVLGIRLIWATDTDSHWSGWAGLRRFATPLAAYVISLGVAWEIWRKDDNSAFGWMVAVILLLMIDAVGNCWDILKVIGENQS